MFFKQTKSQVLYLLRYIFLIFILKTPLLFSMFVYAQNFTSSPYSRFGIGEISQQGFGRNKAMGNTGIALRSKVSLNNLNPASHTIIDSTNFLFDMGGIANFSALKTKDASKSEQDIDFEYFALGFPIENWWDVSIGLHKISNIGFKLDLQTVKDQISYSESYENSGGLNKVYMSNAFKFNNTSIGLNINYLWGKINLDRSIDIIRGIDYRNNEELRVNKFTFDVGVQYEGRINENNTYVIGATFAPKVDITGKYEDFGYRIYGSEIDTVNYTKEKSNALELPSSYGIGFAVTHNENLVVTADYLHQAWANVAFFGDLETLKNSNRFGMGVEYTPSAYSLKSYLNRISYRAGAYYNSSYLKINGKSINEFGISVGASFPIQHTNISVVLQLGKKGTTKHALIKENYAKLSVSFTFYEAWFLKILYD